MIIIHFGDYNNYVVVKLRNGWFIYSTYILVVIIDNLSPKLKNKKQLL